MLQILCGGVQLNKKSLSTDWDASSRKLWAWMSFILFPSLWIIGTLKAKTTTDSFTALCGARAGWMNECAWAENGQKNSWNRPRRNSKCRAPQSESFPIISLVITCKVCFHGCVGNPKIVENALMHFTPYNFASPESYFDLKALALSVFNYSATFSGQSSTFLSVGVY